MMYRVPIRVTDQWCHNWRYLPTTDHNTHYAFERIFPIYPYENFHCRQNSITAYQLNPRLTRHLPKKSLKKYVELAHCVPLLDSVPSSYIHIKAVLLNIISDLRKAIIPKWDRQSLVCEWSCSTGKGLAHTRVLKRRMSFSGQGLGSGPRSLSLLCSSEEWDRVERGEVMVACTYVQTHVYSVHAVFHLQRLLKTERKKEGRNVLFISCSIILTTRRAS